MNSPARAFDAIVIGAGLAGLAAAHTLSAAGRAVLVLEARARSGGRVHTHRDPATDYPIEMGPEWVGTRGDWHSVLRRVNADLRATGGAHLLRTPDGLAAREDFGSMSSVMLRVEQLVANGRDRPLLDAVRECCNTPELAAARQTLIDYVQGFNAADASRVSSQWLLEVEANEPPDASEYHALAGLDWGIDALQTELGASSQVLHRAIVREVRWSDAGVDVHADCNGTQQVFTARHLVCTLPLGVLQLPPTDPHAVQFHPPLSEKAQALDMLAMGHALKIALVFSDAFWTRLDGLKRASFLHAPQARIPTWWTPYPVDAPVMTGWAAGPAAIALRDTHGGSLVEVAIESLAVALGVSREHVQRHLKGWHSHDWSGDPFSRGAYSYVVSGGTKAYASLAQPLRNTLFFAGEATCGLGHNATMEGALQSGKRAAQELLACLPHPA